jgi:hypothetical protein
MTDDRIQALVSGVLERVRGQLQQELTGLAEGLRAHTAEERSAAAQSARADAESAAATLASEAIAAERSAFEQRLADARAEARQGALAEARGDERAADLARAERLLAAVRLLDEAGSLSEALDALAQAAQREAGRAAVLLVRGEELRGWAHAGFGHPIPARSVAVPLAEAGLFGAAVAAATPVSTAQADGTAGPQPPAPYTVDGPDRLGVAAPLVVDGRVVALVYADDSGAAAREVPSAWPEHVELLARHASRCLEALTARQSVRARTGATASQGAGGADDESARRYARLLVSEIKLYHEASVDEGRRLRDLRARLGSQIARARSLYEERVPQGVRTRADFFEQELVRTLADGDAALLGQAS